MLIIISNIIVPKLKRNLQRCTFGGALLFKLMVLTALLSIAICGDRSNIVNRTLHLNFVENNYELKYHSVYNMMDLFRRIIGMVCKIYMINIYTITGIFK